MSADQCAPDRAGIQDLVLVHGWGMSSGVWEALPRVSTARVRLHPIELPGHGEHPLRPPCQGGSDLLGAWANVCLEAAPRQAVWLGWSLGGLVALAAALRSPERIRGLILMTTTPRFTRAPDWPAAMPAETLARFHEGLVADPAGTLARFLALQVRGSDQARETLRRLRQDLASRPPPNPTALALGLGLLRDQDLRPDLRRLRVPSLWLFGSHDSLVPAAVAEDIEHLLPQAEIQVIPGAAHAPFLSHPVRTGESIGTFLAGLARGVASADGDIWGEPDSGPRVQPTEAGLFGMSPPKADPIP